MNEYLQQLKAILERIRQTVVPYRRYMIGGLLAILLFLVGALASLSFIARETMPNDPLYTFKVNVYEPAVRMTKWSDRAQVRYATSLLETRFNELMSLHARNDTGVERISPLIARTTEESQIAYDAITASNMSNEEKLEALFQAGLPVKAMDTLAKNTEALSESKSAFGALLDTVQDHIGDSVRTFASSTDEANLKQFIATHIAHVTELLPSTARGSDAEQLALSRIEYMQEKLAENDYLRALSAILRAEEALLVDSMLWASERGEGPRIGEAATTTEGQ